MPVPSQSPPVAAPYAGNPGHNWSTQADLSALLGDPVRHLIGHSGADDGEIELGPLGRAIFCRMGTEITLDWLTAAPARRGGGGDGGHQSPLTYADHPIGTLRLRWHGAPPPDAQALTAEGARRLALATQRHHLHRWGLARLGRPLLLVGDSLQLRDLEVFVEKAAQSDLPALLHGEFGTEIPVLAAAIHAAGPRRDAPFIQVDCAHPNGQPAQWFAQATGGSLFLSDIDTLAPDLQCQLPRHFLSRLGQWLDVSAAAPVRVIASATTDLRHLVGQGRFSRQLLAELDFLTVAVPPLRDRPDDIAPLVCATLRRHGFDPAAKLAPGALDLLTRHSWPENRFELERVVARLAVLSGPAAIGADDIGRYLPGLADQPAPADGTPPSSATGPAPDRAEDWLAEALAGDAPALETLHPGLRKAIRYLVDHHAEPIRQEVLARHAHVSPSHLSFLFRHGLNMSSRSVLARIRVEKAKQLLVGDRRQPITDIALQVGFADLSHFEKCFRRQVGQTPRQFRQLATR